MWRSRSHISSSLGSPVNRLNILARHASSGLLQTNDPLSGIKTPLLPATLSPRLYTSASNSPIPYAPSHTLTSTFQQYLSFLRFRTALFAIDLAFYLTNWAAWYSHTKRRVLGAVWYGKDMEVKEEGKFEDVLEGKLKDLGE